MIDQKTIDDIKAKNPTDELHRATVTLRENGQLASQPSLELILRAPRNAAWETYKANLQDDRKRLDAGRSLMLACVAHPSIAELQKSLSEHPGFEPRIIDTLVEIAGATARVEHEKL